MHAYAGADRTSIYYTVALLAFTLSGLVHWLLKELPIATEWYFYAPTAAVIFSALFFLFDRYVWKWWYIRRVVAMPNLNGVWEGELASSVSKYQTKHAVKLTVHQYWSRIRITLESDRSMSASHMACIVQVSPTQFELRWEYDARAKIPNQLGKFNHFGITTLRFVIEGAVVQPEMDGNYYTQHDRDTNGMLFVKRVGG